MSSAKRRLKFQSPMVPLDVIDHSHKHSLCGVSLSICRSETVSNVVRWNRDASFRRDEDEVCDGFVGIF